MNKWVHNLMLLAVLYHLLVGCCWHHAHGESRVAARQTDCAHDCRNGLPHEATHHADQPPADESHEHQDACEESRCAFVLPEPDGVSNLANFFAQQAVEWADLPMPDSDRPGYSALEAPPPWSGSSLRLCLVIRVLLI